jgi:hypothetical protein
LTAAVPAVRLPTQLAARSVAGHTRPNHGGTRHAPYEAEGCPDARHRTGRRAGGHVDGRDRGCGHAEAGAATAGARVEIEVAADGLSISRFTVVDVLEPDTEFQTCGGARFSKTVTGAFPVYTPPGGDPNDFVFVSTMPSNNPAATPSEFEFDATIAPGVMTGRFSYQPASGCGSGGNIVYAVSAPGGCMGSPERVTLQSRSDTLAKVIKKLAKKIARAKAADKHGKAKRLGKKKRAAKREFKAINRVLPYFCNLADSI